MEDLPIIWVSLFVPFLAPWYFLEMDNQNYTYNAILNIGTESVPILNHNSQRGRKRGGKINRWKLTEEVWGRESVKYWQRRGGGERGEDWQRRGEGEKEGREWQKKRGKVKEAKAGGGGWNATSQQVSCRSLLVYSNSQFSQIWGYLNLETGPMNRQNRSCYKLEKQPESVPLF